MLSQKRISALRYGVPTFKVIIGLVCIYCVIYIVNSIAGGYWLKPVRDGDTGKLYGVPLTTAYLWQPAYGYCSRGQVSALGRVFYPLIIIDQHFVHQTQYHDNDFNEWVNGLATEDVHPRFRNDFENFIKGKEANGDIGERWSR
jgi:hypothetical protein